MQTKGRGTKNRKWKSLSAVNIYTSIILHDTPNKNNFVGIFTMEVAASLAVYSALSDLGVSGITTKWPNDLWIHGHKLCGVLVEADDTQKLQESQLFVLGIGLNLNADMRRDPDLYSLATSVKCELKGRELQRELVLAHICNHLERTLELSQATLHGMFLQHHMFHADSVINILQGSKVTPGKYFRVLENWSVEIQSKNGDHQTATSREVSIRPSPSKIVYICRGSHLDSVSAARLHQSLVSLVDISYAAIRFLEVENITTDSLNADIMLVVVGDVELMTDASEGVKSVALKTSSSLLTSLRPLLEYMSAGGSVLGVAGGAALVTELLMEGGCDSETTSKITLDEVKTDLTTIQSSQPDSRTVKCACIHPYELHMQALPSDNVLAVIPAKPDSAAVVWRRHHGGRLGLCLCNLEITYADLDNGNMADALKESVFERDVLFQSLLEQFGI